MPSLFSAGDPAVPPMAPVTAAQMPQFAPPPPAPAAPEGLFSRVKHAVANNLFRAPSGLGELVSKDDVANARQQGLLQLGIALSQGHGENPLASLGRGLASAQEGFQGALEGVVQQKQQAIQMQAAAAQQRKMQLHAQLAQQYAAQPNETPEQSISRLTNYASAMAAFDPDAAAKLGETVRALREPTPAPHTIQLGGHALTTDNTGKVLRDDPVTESPAVAARADAVAAAAKRAADAAERANERAAATATRDERRQQNTIVHDFDASKVVKDYHGAEAAYAVLNAARTGGRNFMRPMASLDALARMLNPQGAVRVGTLQILKDQGSLGQKIQRNLSMLQKGEWPAGMQQEVYDMADAIMREHTDDFDHYRDEVIGRAGAQGLDPTVFDQILYHRKKSDPKAAQKQSTGKLGSY